MATSQSKSLSNCFQDVAISSERKLDPNFKNVGMLTKSLRGRNIYTCTYINLITWLANLWTYLSIILQCDSKRASFGLLDMVNSGPQKLLIIGPGCSTSTQAVAEVADYWNLVTVCSHIVIFQDYYIYMAFQLYCRSVQYWAILHSFWFMLKTHEMPCICNNNNIEWP